LFNLIDVTMSTHDEILQRVEKKIDKLGEYLLNQKTALTLEEASAYTGLSRSYLYKLTSTGQVPCFRPRGKMVYFDRTELDKWLLRDQISEEVEIKAATHVVLNREGGLS
jgi:excisionase family DNA binding protein